MKRNTFRLVLALGMLCIAGVILIQIYWVRKAFDLNQRQFEQSVTIALRTVAEKMADLNKVSLPPENPVKQVSSDYYVVNVNDRIDANVLEYYLQTEFIKQDLHLDYEYAIYDCNTDRMVYGKYISAKENSENPEVKTALPKWDEYTYYFGVRFPKRGLYLVDSMNIWIFSSFILLVVIVFFGYLVATIMKQKRLSQMQREFVNNMTHEFKTPLSTIAIAANVLSKPDIEKDPESLHTYAGIIQAENSRLIKQVEKVLQIASVDKDQMKLNTQELDLHELIEKVVSYARLNLLQEGEIKLQLNAISHKIIADELHLTNIIHNLLDNAIKYSKAPPQIVIATKNVGNKLLLSIRDQGIGISRQYHQKVFEKFFRVPTGNIHNVKGFGLGLSYVRRMVEAHRWKIDLQSAENQGTTFTLSIPI
jgi:two-component system, OmpR family, phosphate regulon sensor histidine kinase PhoR